MSALGQFSTGLVFIRALFYSAGHIIGHRFWSTLLQKIHFEIKKKYCLQSTKTP